jgi:hypothetical protein
MHAADYLLLAAVAVIGLITGFVRGLNVRAELALRARARIRAGMHWFSVERRRNQERRARSIALNSDEPENRSCE